MDPSQPKNRLLLIDGDPKSLRVLDVSLKKAGFDVAAATSSREALALLESSKPDLIISDTDLDETDGFELCSQVKSRPAWSKIPFIFVSSRKSIEDKIRGLELGVDDYLTKPIYIKEIGIRVRTALQRAERERMESRREGRTRFAGALSDVGVVDLVQTIELNRKSGIIHILNRDNRRGSIFFRDGKVIDAEVGRLAGAHALYRLFSWQDGQFTVEFKQIRRHDTIAMPMAALLMEGMRRLDESAHLLENLPSLRSVLEVDCRVLADELAELPDEMNSVLRLCDGARTLQEVVEDSDIPDLEVLHILHKLLADQIIFAREAPERGGESETSDRLARWLSEGGTEDGIVAEETSASSEYAASVDLLSDGESIPVVTPPPAEHGPDDAPSAPSALPAAPVAPEAKPSEARRTAPMAGPPSPQKDLGAALLPQPSETSGAPREQPRATDTLRGIPIEGLFSEAGESEVAAESPAAPDSSPAAAASPADGRSTKPLGLAERLLSEDSVVRGEAMRESLGDIGGRITSPQKAESKTREYGDPAVKAAALVYEIVSSARASKIETHPSPAEPERPSKEVDWGAWPTRTPGGAPPASGSSPAPLPAAPEASSLASLSVDEPKQSAMESTAAPAPSAEPGPGQQGPAATEPGPDQQGPAETEPGPGQQGPAETEAAQACEVPEAEARRGQGASGTGAAWADLGLVREGGKALGPSPGASASSSQEGLTPGPSGEGTGLRWSRTWQAWAVALVGFAAGVVGYLLWIHGASVPEEPTASDLSMPAGAASVQAPAAAPPAQPVVNQDQAAAVPAAQEKSPEAPAAPSSPVAAEAPGPDELRRQCLHADDDGKGRARAVVAACRPALAADPNAADVMLILARAALDRGRLGEARSLAKKALAAEPRLAEGYIYLGNAEQEAGNLEKARAAYKKYLELAPTGRFAREMRAVLDNM